MESECPFLYNLQSTSVWDGTRAVDGHRSTNGGALMDHVRYAACLRTTSFACMHLGI